MQRLLLVVVLGCGNAEPPFHELPLRDTLLADPRLIAAMPADQRAQLRDRFTNALADASLDESKLDASATDARVSEYDAQRERDGRDADLIVRLKKDGLHTRGRGVAMQLPPSGDPMVLTQDLAPDSVETQALETQALAGRAGALLRALAGAEKTRRAVRVVGWPTAVTREGDTLFVNAAWLVAMASDAQDGPRIAVAQQALGLTVETVTDINLCYAQVSTQCAMCRADRAMCAGDPILSDFGSAADECDAIGNNGDIARYVCRAAGFQRGDVVECVKKNEPDCLADYAFSTTAFWRAFETKPICAKIMEKCLNDPNYTWQISCDACSCGSCKSGSCVSCNPTCNTGSCNTNGCKQPSCKLCAQTEPVPFDWRHFSQVPFALFPLLLFWRMSRRRV